MQKSNQSVQVIFASLLITEDGRAILVDLENSRPSRGRDDERADLMNLHTFARRLIAAGVTPPPDSDLKISIAVVGMNGMIKKGREAPRAMRALTHL